MLPRLTFGFCLSWEALLAQTPLPGLAPEALRSLDEQGVFWSPHHHLPGELTHLLAGPCRMNLQGSGLSKLPAVSHPGDRETSALFPGGAGRTWAEGSTILGVRTWSWN